ncbi:MAG: flippase-like domain-containing protein [Magnetococcales bacterium]|nr:flippase-like domain-containing protein [Magnetococcales bacterium]
MRVLKFILAAGLLYWLFQGDQLHLERLGDRLFTTGHLWVMLLCCASYLGQTLRWWSLLRVQGIEVRFLTLLRLFFIGQFFFLTSLGSVAGETAKGYYVLGHVGEARVAGVSTVLVDPLLGLGAYFLIGGLATLFRIATGVASEVEIWLGSVLLLILAAMAGGVLLVGSSRVRRMVLARLPATWRDRLLPVLDAYHPCRGGMPKVILIALLTSFIYFLAFKMAGHAMDMSVGWDCLFVALPLLMIAFVIPMPLGSLGVGESAAQLLLQQWGIPNGAMIMLLLRVTKWMLLLPPGLYCYLSERGARTG